MYLAAKKLTNILLFHNHTVNQVENTEKRIPQLFYFLSDSWYGE